MSLWAMRSVLRAMPHNVGNVHGGMRAMRSATAASRTAMVGTHMQRQFMRMSYATAAPNGGQQTQQKKEEGKADEGGSAWSDKYTKAMATMHWIGAIGITFLIASAMAARQIPNDPAQTTKEKYAMRQLIMHNHESVGLLMLLAMVPRVAFRLIAGSRGKLPRTLPEPMWQVVSAKVAHGLLYGVLIFMPISGLAFGYLSGWGVPFFKWNVPGASKEAAQSDFNKKWEKFFYENHHRVGNFLTWYLFPIHIGALGFTYFVRGHSLFKRMLPWRK